MFTIREARPSEYREVGQLLVTVYGQLNGFPGIKEQPKYYEILQNIGEVAMKPLVKLIVAMSDQNAIAGAVVYFGNMKSYGSGGLATNEENASGFRLLAVSLNARGHGLGGLLSMTCIDMAREAGHKQMIIHSTKSMQIAWKMYYKMGFRRSQDLDFVQENMQVFGFRLDL